MVLHRETPGLLKTPLHRRVRVQARSRLSSMVKTHLDGFASFGACPLLQAKTSALPAINNLTVVDLDVDVDVDVHVELTVMLT